MMKRPMLALIAHDSQKNALIKLAAEEEYLLRHESIVATKSTGESVAGAGLHLAVTTVESGHRGGDLQIAAAIIEGKVDGVIFLRDNHCSHAHQVDIAALHRVAALYGVPVASSAEAAKILIRTRRRKRELRRVEPIAYRVRQSLNPSQASSLGQPIY